MKKQALVTGACGGIGREVVRLLDEGGYRVILVDIDQAALSSMAGVLQSGRYIVCDLTDRQALSQLCNSIENELGGIDVAFVNAGLILPGSLTELEADRIDQQIDINFRSAVHIIRSCALNMSARETGHILATVSIGGILSLKGSATYSATKFALRGLLAGLRDELLDKNIRVSGIYPSGVDTAMLEHEALHGGSALNFLSQPQTVNDVGKAFLRALDKGALEVYVPYADSLSARLAGGFPWVMKYLYPGLEWLGERGRERYIQTIRNRDSHESS